MLPLLLPFFHHVVFDDHKPTVYENHGSILSAHVEASASFLFQPFDAPRRVQTLSFSWRVKSGSLPPKTVASESEKSGDDAPVRIGLLISGKAPLIPFFAPSWIKAVRDHAKLPADDLIFVVAGSKHPAGSVWPSPYDQALRLIAPVEQPDRDGWTKASHTFDPPLSVVGLWIMADGDDTGSRFDAEVRDLELN